MARKHGPWSIEQRTTKYRNGHLHLQEDKVIQPDGKPGHYATVEVKPGVSVLALDEEGNAYLTRQFRYALGRESIEVVCGGMNEDEKPLDTARRELREELGIEAEEWIELGVCDPDTSLVCGPGYLFLARHLGFGKSKREGTEVIEMLKVPFQEAVRMVLEDEITHGPSSVLILKAARLGF